MKQLRTQIKFVPRNNNCKKGYRYGKTCEVCQNPIPIHEFGIHGHRRYCKRCAQKKIEESRRRR